MTSWVYIFSKFTPEALLFEALIIFLLCCGYTAFWVLRKRRYGSVDATVPSGPVKTYLNELIMNSEQLRLQLFGLLAASDQSATSLYRLVGGGMTGVAGLDGNADAAKKVAILEAKLMEQLKALEALAAEKARLEKELAELKSRPAGGGSEEAAPSASAGKDDSGTIVRLQQRIQDLESKLAEYNVIEDDLANLKRLQQENTVLKAALAEKGIQVPGQGSPSPLTWSGSNEGSSAAAPGASDAPASPAAPDEGGDAFASLAGQVENSLQQPPTPSEPSNASSEGSSEASSSSEPSAAASSEPAPAAESAEQPQATAPKDAGSADASPPAPAMSDHEKSEADLVAEFEKMLKG